VENGWKTDANTFKPRYIEELEKYLHKKKPNFTLKANTHIESRMKLLKRQYGAIKEMLSPNASGFGWDDTRKMIVVDHKCYKQWCKIIFYIRFYNLTIYNIYLIFYFILIICYIHLSSLQTDRGLSKEHKDLETLHELKGAMTRSRAKLLQEEMAKKIKDGLLIKDKEGENHKKLN